MKTTAARIGERIRTARQTLGITQETLADRMGCRQSYVSAVERGGSRPSIDMLTRFASALETTASDLMKGL